MKSKIIIRVFIDLLIFISVLNGWWFVALPLAIVATWFLPLFLEFIVAGIAFDALFGMTQMQGFAGYEATVVSLVLFLIIILLRKMIRK